MSWNWLSERRGEPHPNTNKGSIDQNRTRRKASSMAPLHSHDPGKSRGKTLTRTRKKKERMKKKSRRTTSATSKNKLHQRHKGLRLSRKKETWHRPRINRPLQGNEKFGPLSSCTERKHQTQMASKRPTVMNKKGKSTRRWSGTFKQYRHWTRQKTKEVR